MAKFKINSHSLYDISRQTLYFDSFKSVEPILMNKEHQIFTMSIFNNYKDLLFFMVNNFYDYNGINELLFNYKSKNRNRSVLHYLCEYNNIKTLNILISMIDNYEKYKDLLLIKDKWNMTPLWVACHKENYNIIQYLLLKLTELKNNQIILCNNNKKKINIIRNNYIQYYMNLLSIKDNIGQSTLIIKICKLSNLKILKLLLNIFEIWDTLINDKNDKNDKNENNYFVHHNN